MTWLFSMLAMLCSFSAPGSDRHERALAGLYAMQESHAMLVMLTEKTVEHVPVSVTADGEAPVQIEEGWTGPAHQYTAVVERPAVLEADGVHCNPRLSERVRESWYVICMRLVEGSPYCTVISIDSVCCVTEREEVGGDRCEAG